MFSKIFKLSIPHLIAVGVFLLTACMYFTPQLQGKKLPQGDITSFRGMAQEIIQYRKDTGKETYWTNSMFGGMPAYQVSMRQSSNAFSYISRLTKLFLTGPLGLFLSFMIGGYVMLILMNVDYRIAIIASIAFAFSTYNILLVDGGHNSKINTVGYLGIMLGGMYLIFEKKKYLWGGLAVAIGMALSTYANHIQMTYYFLICLGIYGLILLIKNIKTKEGKSFGKGIATILIAGILGFMTSSQRMLPTYEYQKDTMRGKPILTTNTVPGSSSSVKGLDWDYATKWSHKPIDLLAMLIPKAAGGGNEIIEPGTTLRAALNQRGYGSQKFYLYWGGLDFTGGPAYFSMVLWFFMLYFLIASKHPLRWWVVGSIVLLSLMSLGKYFEVFNKLLFDVLPLLNKFRAPGSIATVIAIPLAVGGAMGINHFFFSKDNQSSKWKGLKWTGIGMGGFLMLATLLGLAMNSFQGLNDANYEQAGIMDAVLDARQSVFLSAGFRSIIIAGLCFLTAWAVYKKWLQVSYAILALGLIIIGDLWQLDKQYLPNSKFVDANLVENPIRPRPVDDLIKKDNDLHFRVHDISVDPWNSSIASYFHKTVGGYSPAKLQRYQDIIDRYLIQNNQKMLNMLNTRYIISSVNGGNPTANINTAALGNAWLVNEYFVVQTAENEINGINGIDPEEKAIIHTDFASYMQGLQIDKNGTIELTAYAPNQLTYKSNTTSEQLAIFSEIWYGPDKGWNAYVDGEKVDHIRANYILRAMRVPAGEHTIEFKFEPKLVKIGSMLSFITSLGLIGGLFGLGYISFKNMPKKEVQIKKVKPVAKRAKKQIKNSKTRKLKGK